MIKLLTRWLIGVLPILAGTVAMLSVVAIDGHPQVFTDTDDYFVQGRTGALDLAYAFGVIVRPPPPTTAEAIADAEQTQSELHMSRTEIGARSPYYGAFLYLTQKLGTLWLTTAVQALIGAILIQMLWRRTCPRAPIWTAYVTQVFTAAATTLPFFAGFAMPDVFAGYAAIATILLLAFWSELTVGRRVALGLLLAFAMSTHTSHLLNTLGAVVLAAGGYILFRAPRRQAWEATFAVLGAVVMTLLANATYKESVQMRTGDEIRRPPFLAMRVIADGPGREYLRAECGKNGVDWTLCQFKNEPNVDSQDMLWSDDRSKGIFNVTSFENRLAMEKEENGFVIQAVAFDPLQQVVASLRNFGDQIVMVYLDDPLKNPHYYLTNDYWSTTSLPWLIDHVADCGRDNWGCGPRLTMDGSMWLHPILLILGLLLVGLRLTFNDLREGFRARQMLWSDERARLLMVMGLLVASVVINAFVCGALSGPFARYQARITWLVTLAGALGFAQVVPAWATLPILYRVGRMLPLVAAFERRFDFAFIRFGLVGTAGFLVHATVLHLAVDFVGLNAYLGWLCGFAVAVTTTFLLNRAFTFRAPSHHTTWRLALIYLGVQGAGAAANFATYAVALAALPILHHALFVPLAMGSVAGLGLTFVGSKYIAFRPAKVAEAPAP